jgi:hypothetical protein
MRDKHPGAHNGRGNKKALICLAYPEMEVWEGNGKIIE